jgi:hypothetical protein
MLSKPAMNRRLLLSSVLLSALGGLWPVQRPAVAGEVFTDIVPGVGVGGYDVVAYFNRGEATLGSPEFTQTWRGAVWRFASASNRTAFAADPERYAPAYGGHCSWAVAQGYKAKGDPKNWKIVNGRLFLNYNDEIQKRWELNIGAFVRKADATWSDLKGR